MQDVVVITGSSRGLGLAACHYLSSRGLRVIGGSRHVQAPQVDQVAKFRTNGGIINFPLDVAEPDSIRSFFAQVSSLCGTPKFLINNAGACYNVYATNTMGIERNYAINFFGTLLTTALFTNQATPPAVINIGSATATYAKSINWDLATNRGRFSMSESYVQSKLMVMLFTRAMVERQSIQMNCLHPGLLRTTLGHESITARVASLIAYPFTRAAATGANNIFQLISKMQDKSLAGKYFDQGKEAAMPECVAVPEASVRFWETFGTLFDAFSAYSPTTFALHWSQKNRGSST